MRSRPQARVWGDSTRGDMLVGVWYALKLLGSGYTLSVPEATYLSPDGFEIEGHGVAPQRRLIYKLDEARRGQDSWLRTALANY
jgi:C-terminal processing protease CtpA/Prc